MIDITHQVSWITSLFFYCFHAYVRIFWYESSNYWSASKKGTSKCQITNCISYDEGLNKDGFAEETLQSGMASLSVEGKDKNEIEEDRRDQRDDDDYMFFRIDGLNFNGKGTSWKYIKTPYKKPVIFLQYGTHFFK